MTPSESGRRDLNPRPPAPEAGALPSCATPRMRPGGFEPPAFWSVARRSIQLSYGRGWWGVGFWVSGGECLPPPTPGTRVATPPAMGGTRFELVTSTMST